MNRTKIICTAGPSVASQSKIENLVKSGMSILRLNCSHGDNKTREEQIARVRKAEKKLGKPIGIMIDLQGPKLRVGDIPKPLMLHSGETWKLGPHLEPSEKHKTIPIGFKKLGLAVSVGGRIYMDDGLIRTQVLKKTVDEVWVKIINGGQLESRKGLNIPYYKGDLPVLSKKDKDDLKWALSQNVDFIALSFVRSANDINMLKKLIDKNIDEHTPLVIAKIEKPEAVENLQEIVKVSDGVLVARGDLGIELSLPRVPVVQKQIIEVCRKEQKPVIVATQMLDSMRYHPIPTRAEVSDVASAIYAGADAVMLTGETSAGKFPIEATKMLNQIAHEVEAHMIQKTFRKMPKDFGLASYRDAFIFNVMQMADDIQAKAIVMLTRRGRLTKVLSKLHPKQPVYSLAANHYYYRRLTLYWGVYPIETNHKLAGKRIKEGVAKLRKKSIVKKGDRLIFVFWDYQSDNLNMKIVEC
ncbi:MAG: pyruvate kinase [Deltaproteobacteria bacterium]|nr:pyruvate kinase [Deltaproteobacteria bacterium]